MPHGRSVFSWPQTRWAILLGDAFTNFDQNINVRSVLDGDFADDSEYVFNFLIGRLVFEISAIKVLEISVSTRGETRINALRHRSLRAAAEGSE